MNGLQSRSYRLLVLDIDGTLLDDRNQITKHTLQALQDLQEKGFSITLATGRLYRDAFYFARRLALSSPLILLHGAFIQSYEGEIMVERDLPPGIVSKLVNIARENRVSFQALCSDRLILEQRTKWNDLYLKYSPNKPEIVCVPDLARHRDDKIAQFSFLGEGSKMLQMKELLAKQLGDTVSIACSHPNLLEVVAPGVSKGSALKELSGMMNIPLSQTIAIGDNYNDRELLQTAGLGVAMGNAPREIKEIADYITKDNNHDGIAYFAAQFMNSDSLKSPKKK